ncbi:RNA polymerase sigma-70 factor [Sunxiuqinia rutila]|uniref:RNA polymerase sigma-70 factor n=1 Tax=Sunxiuqinia rutila TaxID=1397841 RepID=UPI003D36C3DE
MKDLIDWNKIREGDKSVFERMFDLYFQPLCGFASTYLKNNHIVEDIVIECFVEIWEKRESIVIRSSLHNYLLTAVKNSSISFLRKNKVQFSELEGLTLDYDDSKNPLDELPILNRLYLAINKLPEKRRQILKMAAYEGKSYPEIAEELGISINTVKTQMSRSYKFLKDELNVSDRSIFFLLSL